MSLLVTVVTGNLAHVFSNSSFASSAGGVGRIETSGRGGVFPSLLLALLFLFLLPSLLVGVLNILEARGMGGLRVLGLSQKVPLA